MKKMEEQLLALQDLQYRDFHTRLMPEYQKDLVIGVRTPALRRLAKELARDPVCREFLEELPHKYYEENNLHAYLIEYVSKTFGEAMDLTEKFLPYIDNWATCDTFKPKAFGKDLDALYGKTMEWMGSSHVYTVRYGIVTQLHYFLDDHFRSEMLDFMAEIPTDAYYVNMALAWYYSFALIKQYSAAIPLFEERRLDKWVHNKSLQKAIESFRISKETKEYLRSLKIK